MAELRDLWRGLRVVYRFVPRGGYGFAMLLPATVLDVKERRVRILVEGSSPERRLMVSPNSLTIRDMTHVRPAVDVSRDSSVGGLWSPDVASAGRRPRR